MNLFKLQQYIGISYLSLDDNLTFVPDSNNTNLIWSINDNIITNHNKKVLKRDIVDPNVILLDKLEPNNKLEFIIVGTPIGRKILEKNSGFFLGTKILPDNKFQLVLTNTLCDEKNKVVIDWLITKTELPKEKKEGFNSSCDSKNRSMILMVFLIIILIFKYCKKDV